MIQVNLHITMGPQELEQIDQGIKAALGPSIYRLWLQHAIRVLDQEQEDYTHEDDYPEDRCDMCHQSMSLHCFHCDPYPN